MIIVVSGKLGSGKSYETVRMMCDHLIRGGAVRTNISLDYLQISKGLARTLHSWQVGTLSATDDPKLIPTGDHRGSRHQRKTMVVLDEALNWFASKDARSDLNRETWGEWLRQSDKLGQDVYFIAQNFERSAKWIRELAHKMIEIIPLSDVKLLWIIPIWWLLPFFRKCYAVNVYDVRSKTRLGLSIHRYSSFYWRFYRTDETYGFVGASSAYSGNIPPPFKLSPLPLWLSIISLIATLGLLFLPSFWS